MMYLNGYLVLIWEIMSATVFIIALGSHIQGDI